jgi:ligand-binding sensor domain-containing protein/two-component sensor histidine kinase
MCRLRFFLRTVITISSLLFLQNIYAQENLITSEYSYRHYTTDDGLPSYSLESVFQDSKGFIWVGCSGGIAKYDGFTFHRYLEGRFTNISRISENQNEEVNAYGLDLYTLDKEADTVKTTKLPKGYFSYKNNHTKLPSKYVLLNKNYSDEKALFELSDTGFVKILEHPDFEKVDMFSGRIFIDEKQKEIYVPMSDGISVLSFKGTRIAFYSNYFVRNFIQYQGDIWFITENGLYRIHQDKIELVKSLSVGADVNNVNICIDKKGGLLFSDNVAVYRLADNEIETIFSGVNQITDMLIDTEGNLWVTTYEGLFNLFQFQFKNYWLQNKNDVVRGIVVDDNNDIIVGSYDGKLIRFNEMSATEISYPPNELGYFFNPYFTKKNNDLFLVGAGKVLKISGENKCWLNLPVQNYEFVQTLFDGNLVAGGRDGIQFFTPDGKFLKTLTTDTLLQDIHSKICEDKNGNLWCGGGKGVTLIAKNEIKLISNDLLKPALVFEKDNEGNVWLASENRLLRAEKDSVKLIHTYASSIETILFTRDNYLIVGTSSGIYISDTECKQIILYDNQNGFTGKEIMRSSMVQDNNGNVWLPSVTCLVKFNPEELLIKQIPPKLYILSFLTSKNNVHWEKQNTSDIKLKHTDKNIRIKFIGLSYSQAQNVRYQYRMQGFQSEWSQPIAEREITYNNLPPGRYVFEIKCNAGTQETETETVSLPIHIKPAFWQTLFCKIVAFTLLAAIIASLAIRYQRREHEKEIRKANREKEMNELRVQSVRLKSIPHFNSNVLAGIEYFIMTKSKEEANELLTTYSRFTNITLHDIDKAQRSLKDELEYVSMYLELEKMRYGDKLSYDIDIDSNVDQNIMIPNMVLHTFAENAIKHGVRGKIKAGKVTISIKNENSGVRISVEDDGVGRAVSEQKNIAQNRKGQGLNILSRQIELYNQQNSEKIEYKVVDLTDEYGSATGTRFELYVPYNYEYI